jgi:hypothetical protein
MVEDDGIHPNRSFIFSGDDGTVNDEDQHSPHDQSFEIDPWNSEISDSTTGAHETGSILNQTFL